MTAEMPRKDEDHGSGDPRADRRADYAAELARDGDHAAAADLLRQALDLAPGWAAGWTVLGGYREAAGDAAEAIEAWREALRLDPADGQGAGLRLAAIGAAETPATAPPAFVKGLFDQYARRFEASLIGKLDYAAPDLLFEALQDVAGPSTRFSRVLDLGCGTGLMGERLRGISDYLAGVDLSPGMLRRARAKGLYDNLVEADISALPLPETPFDLATAADVLNYVGDLQPVLVSVAGNVGPGALLAFTLEAHDGPEAYRLGPALRYAHRADAVAALCEASGFNVLTEHRVVLRKDRGAPVAGFVMVTRRVGG